MGKAKGRGKGFFKSVGEACWRWLGMGGVAE